MRDRVQHALDFAVAKEREAEAFYKRWAAQVIEPAVKALFAELAAAERGHMEMLSRIMPEDLIGRAASGWDEADRGLSDLLVDVRPSAETDLQTAILLAIQREEVAIALYQRLAELGGEAGPLFRALAGEERRHRQCLEAEHDRRTPAKD